MENILYFDKYLNVWQEETADVIESYNSEITLSYFTESSEPKKSLFSRIKDQIAKVFQACRDAIDKLIAKITGKENKAININVKMEKIKLEKQYQYNKAILQRIRGAKTMKELEDIQKDIKRGKFIKIAAVTVSAAALLGAARFLKKTKDRNKQIEAEITKLSTELEKEREEHKGTKEILGGTEAELALAKDDVRYYKTRADKRKEELAKEKEKLQTTVSKYEDMIDTLKRERVASEKSLKDQMRQQKAKIEEDNRSERLQRKADFNRRYEEGLQKTRTAYEKRMDKLQESKRAAEEKILKLERELRNTKQDLAATKKSAEIDHDAALAGFGHRMENDKLRSELKLQKNLAADGWAARDKLYDEKMKLTAQIAGMVSKSDVEACREIVQKHDGLQDLIGRQQLKHAPEAGSKQADNQYVFDAVKRGRQSHEDSMKATKVASAKSIARRFSSQEQLDKEVDRLRDRKRSVEQRLKNASIMKADKETMNALYDEKEQIEISYRAVRDARHLIYKRERDKQMAKRRATNNT